MGVRELGNGLGNPLGLARRVATSLASNDFIIKTLKPIGTPVLAVAASLYSADFSTYNIGESINIGDGIVTVQYRTYDGSSYRLYSRKLFYADPLSLSLSSAVYRGVEAALRLAEGQSFQYGGFLYHVNQATGAFQKMDLDTLTLSTVKTPMSFPASGTLTKGPSTGLAYSAVANTIGYDVNVPDDVVVLGNSTLPVVNRGDGTAIFFKTATVASKTQVIGFVVDTTGTVLDSFLCGSLMAGVFGILRLAIAQYKIQDGVHYFVTAAFCASSSLRYSAFSFNPTTYEYNSTQVNNTSYSGAATATTLTFSGKSPMLVSSVDAYTTPTLTALFPVDSDGKAISSNIIMGNSYSQTVYHRSLYDINYNDFVFLGTSVGYPAAFSGGSAGLLTPISVLSDLEIDEYVDANGVTGFSSAITPRVFCSYAAESTTPLLTEPARLIKRIGKNMFLALLSTSGHAYYYQIYSGD